MSRTLRSAIARNRARQAEIAASLETSRIKIKADFPAADPNREPVIVRILAASRTPCPAIVASKQLLASDGNWYSCYGFPIGVSMVEPAELRIVGYVYQNPEGTTYGTRHVDEATARAKHDAYQDRCAADFRASMETDTTERFAEQVAYWLAREL